MGDRSDDPVDHHRTTRQRAGEGFKDSAKLPGIALLAAGLVAFVICLAGFAVKQVGIGVAAIIVALLATGAGLGWFAFERRRLHAVQRTWAGAGAPPRDRF